MRWVHAHPSHYGTSSNATKQYWTEAARQLMTSHAALYCSLYDEVSRMTREGIALVAALVLAAAKPCPLPSVPTILKPHP
eukprot:scaffold7785_cov27-Tisochrysis_lutea.AAC.3